MRRVLFGVFLVVACETVAAADSYEDAVAAFMHKDYTLAARLFLPVAEQGSAKVQYNLGLMYDKGQGVPQDFTRAYMWLNVASTALSGDEGKAAMKNRYHVVSQMTAAQIGKAQEMARRCPVSVRGVRLGAGGIRKNLCSSLR